MYMLPESRPRRHAQAWNANDLYSMFGLYIAWRLRHQTKVTTLCLSCVRIMAWLTVDNRANSFLETEHKLVRLFTALLVFLIKKLHDYMLTQSLAIPLALNFIASG